MIRVELRNLLERIEKETGHKCTLLEVSKETKIHRNLLTKLAASPAIKFTTLDINRLVQFAVHKLRHVENPLFREINPNDKLTDRQLLESILSDLVQVYPDVTADSVMERQIFEVLTTASQPLSKDQIWALVQKVEERSVKYKGGEKEAGVSNQSLATSKSEHRSK